MSFFSSSPYKPQIRQEGFSPTPATNTNTNTHTNGGGSPPPESIDSPTLSNSPGGGAAAAGGFNDLFSHSFMERWVPDCFVGNETSPH